MKRGIRKFLALIWFCAIPRLFSAIAFFITCLLKDFCIRICHLLCVNFPCLSFHLLWMVRKGAKQLGPYFLVTHLVCLIFHGIEDKICSSLFFCYVKLVDFLPVNEVGLLLAWFLSAQGEVWCSQRGLSHKKKDTRFAEQLTHIELL